MATESTVILDKQGYRAGRYKSGIIVPTVGMSRFALQIARPDPSLSEPTWRDRGTGGNLISLAENNDKVECRVSGRDTEILQGFIFASDDAGATWYPIGHVGTMGGTKLDLTRQAALITSLFGELPRPAHADTRLQAVIRTREDMYLGARLLLNDRAPSIKIRQTHRSLAFEDQGSAGGTTASSVSTGTITPANARRYIIGAGSILELGTPGDLSATYDGNACTGIADSGDVSISGVNWRIEMLEYAGGDSLAAGVFTLSTTNTGFFISAAAHAYSDVDQTTPSNTPSSAASGETSTPAVTVAAGAGGVRVAFATGRREASDVTSGANQNARSETNNVGAQDYWIAGDDKDAGESDNTFDWTVSGGGPYTWLAIGVELNEDTGAGAAKTGSAAITAPAPALAATAEVVRHAAAAIDTAPLVLAAAADAVRSASGALQLAAIELAADADALITAAAALGIPATSLSAAAAVERSAAVTIAAPVVSLAASADAERSASAAIDAPAVQLAGGADAGRSASAAITVSGPALAAAVGVERNASAAIDAPAPELAASASIVRLATGALAIAVPIVNATTTGQELTVSAALNLQAPILDVGASIERSASGGLTITAPVLAGGVEKTIAVQAVVLIEPITLAGQADLERAVSAGIDIPAAVLAAQSSIGGGGPIPKTRTFVADDAPRVYVVDKAARVYVAQPKAKTYRLT